MNEYYTLIEILKELNWIEKKLKWYTTTFKLAKIGISLRGMEIEKWRESMYGLVTRINRMRYHQQVRCIRPRFKMPIEMALISAIHFLHLIYFHQQNSIKWYNINHAEKLFFYKSWNSSFLFVDSKLGC